MQLRLTPSTIFATMFSAMLFPALLVPTASAQVTGQNAKPGTAAAPFTITTTSKLVIEAVNVRDKKGNSIPGLTAKDFTVTEDGVKQTVRTCEYQELPTVAAPLAKPEPENIKVYNRLAVTQIAKHLEIGKLRAEDELFIVTVEIEIGSEFDTTGNSLFHHLKSNCPRPARIACFLLVTNPV